MSAPSAPLQHGEHVDVLIVGSGPAGSTYARIIGDAHPEAAILVAEVGPRLSECLGEHTTNMNDHERVACQMLSQGPDAGVARAGMAASVLSAGTTARTDEPFVFAGLFLVGDGSKVDGEAGLPAACMSSGIGGMGVHWAGSCPRPNGSERIPLIPAAELDAAYETAEQLLAVTHDLHAGDELLASLRDVVGAEFDRDAPDAVPVGFMPVAHSRDGDRVRTSGTAEILGDLATRAPRFSIRPDTLVRRVLVEDGAAVGAELMHRTTGTAYEVRARRVVVCCDSLRTPQLLFASGIRPAALGHHLNDHFQMSAFAKLNDEFVREMPAGDVPAPMGSVLIPCLGRARPMQGQVVPLSRTGFRVAVGESDAPVALEELAIVVCYGAKDIQYRDAVEFSDTEHDWYGMPAITIHYRHTDVDRQTIELLRANTERAGVLVGALLTEPTLAPGGSSLHYQGTVRMGAADDGRSVCDTYSRVWGLEHLYVGGNGVIPTSTAANPTLTTVALAVRAATHLAADL